MEANVGNGGEAVAGSARSRQREPATPTASPLPSNEGVEEGSSPAFPGLLWLPTPAQTGTDDTADKPDLFYP